jgi:hypothetical protein
MHPMILQRALLDELTKLRTEIQGYPDEPSLWAIGNDVRNSAGNLVLHQVGAIRHLVGHVLGSDPYARDREAEFSRSDIAREELLAGIDAATAVVRQTLERMTIPALEADYPADLGIGRPVPTAAVLVRLAMHTAYHNGQINYHRRLLSSGMEPVAGFASRRKEGL